MHAAFSQSQAAEPGRPIRGIFYQSDGPRGGGSIGSVIPKVLAILVAMAVIRTIVGAARGHGGSSRWSRRREAIAQFHRELHAEDTAAQSADTP